MSDALLRKYANEFVLEFADCDRFLFKFADREAVQTGVTPEILERLDNCHIYILGKRPRLCLLPDSIQANEEFVHFTLEYKIKGALRQIPVEVPRKFLSPNEVSFEASPHPHRNLISRNASKEIVAETVLATYVDFIPDAEHEAKDIKVLYVGKGLRKSAMDRLANHETVQKILSSMNSEDLDSELFVLIYNFKPRKHLLQLLHVPVEITGELAKKHNQKCMDYKPHLDVQVALIEPSIISYFQPERNTHYLDWPRRYHKLVKELNEADFAGMETVLDNSSMGAQRLYSAKVKAKPLHNILVDFRALEGRAPFIPSN
jgi:hypothetical protein